jgi:hypothetical protein
MRPKNCVVVCMMTMLFLLFATSNPLLAFAGNFETPDQTVVSSGYNRSLAEQALMSILKKKSLANQPEFSQGDGHNSANSADAYSDGSPLQFIGAANDPAFPVPSADDEEAALSSANDPLSPVYSGEEEQAGLSSADVVSFPFQTGEDPDAVLSSAQCPSCAYIGGTWKVTETGTLTLTIYGEGSETESMYDS